MQINRSLKERWIWPPPPPQKEKKCWFFFNLIWLFELERVVSFRVDKNKADGHTYIHTDTGDDNTRRAILTSGNKTDGFRINLQYPRRQFSPQPISFQGNSTCLLKTMMFDITKDSEHVYAMGIYNVLQEQSSAFSLTPRLNLFSIHRLVADDKECAVYVNLPPPPLHYHFVTCIVLISNRFPPPCNWCVRRCYCIYVTSVLKFLPAVMALIQYKGNSQREMIRRHVYIEPVPLYICYKTSVNVVMFWTRIFQVCFQVHYT